MPPTACRRSFLVSLSSPLLLAPPFGQQAPGAHRAGRRARPGLRQLRPSLGRQPGKAERRAPFTCHALRTAAGTSRLEKRHIHTIHVFQTYVRTHVRIYVYVYMDHSTWIAPTHPPPALHESCVLLSVLLVKVRLHAAYDPSPFSVSEGLRPLPPPPSSDCEDVSSERAAPSSDCEDVWSEGAAPRSDCEDVSSEGASPKLTQIVRMPRTPGVAYLSESPPGRVGELCQIVRMS